MDLIKQKSAKKDARQPDIVTAELKKGFEWTTHHTKTVVGAIVAFLIIGGGITAWNMMRENSEKDLQAKYFDLESQVLKKKEDFETAKHPKPPPPAEDKKDAKVEKTPSPATGDLAKDYGNLPEQLAEFASKNSSTKAGAMAALTYANLMAEYKKTDDGITVLRKVQTSGILAGLVSMELATLLANSGKCDEAIGMMEKMLANPATTYLKLEAKLKIGLCAQQGGNLAKAEQNYLQVIDEGKDSATAKSAQKYLRLLQIKKSTEAKTN